MFYEFFLESLEKESGDRKDEEMWKGMGEKRVKKCRKRSVEKSGEMMESFGEM